MAANAHEYSSMANARRAARNAAKRALGDAYEAYEGPDYIIHPSAKPAWEPQGWRFELRGPAANIIKESK